MHKWHFDMADVSYFNKISLLCTSSSVVSPRASLNSRKRCFGNAFVLMSASWSLDVMYSKSIRPCLI